MMNIEYVKFQKKYQSQVEAMVFEGLKDTAKNDNEDVKNAINRYLKRSLNEDLGDIFNNYMKNGIFFLALQRSSDMVLGSLGAEYIDGKQFRLKRLSVKIGFRGNGIAKNLLNQIETWVMKQNGTELILGTSEIQRNAFKFWTSHGFGVDKTELSENGIKLFSLRKNLKL